MYDKTCLQNISETTASLNTDVQSLHVKVDSFMDNQSVAINSQLQTLKKELLDCLNTKFQEVKDSCSGNTGTVEFGNTKTLYAAVANNSKVASVMLLPKNQDQNILVTKTDVLQAVDPVTAGVTFSDTKSGKNGSLIIKCINQEDATKISNTATDKLSENYVVKELPKLKPRVRIVGFTFEDLYKNGTLSNYIVVQNKHLFPGSQDCDIINFTQIKSKRSNDNNENRNVIRDSNSNKKYQTKFQALIQVDNAAYKSILHSGHLIVGLDYCLAYDAVEVRRCFNCCGFNTYQNNVHSENQLVPGVHRNIL
ncbi:hypothetical protein Zmor_021789 [Zophobas morio]|uniref:Uncharacterized protein n=1 Tax=Zophobas morio TaxID=2755281 RepID=A0AA38I8T2_9CUCU|nr:hypothetical protein Zmor_021789 [Zophobas morio]